MLPYSCTEQQRSAFHVQRETAPPVPNVRTHPYLTNILSLIVVEIVNKAISFKDRNPIRMFLFNMLSYNNWQNEQFNEVFQYCHDHILLMASRNNAGVESIYQSSVDTILYLYSSELVYKFQELQAYASPEVMQVASQNAGVFHNLKVELQRMNGSPMQHNFNPQFNQGMQPYQQPMQQPMQQPTVVFDPNTGMWVQVNMPQMNNMPMGGYQPPGQAFIPQNHLNQNFNTSGRMVPNKDVPSSFGLRSYGNIVEDNTPPEHMAPGRSVDLVSNAFELNQRSFSVNQKDHFAKEDPAREERQKETPYEVISSIGEQFVDQKRHEIPETAKIPETADTRVALSKNSEFELVIKEAVLVNNIEALIPELRMAEHKHNKDKIIVQYAVVNETIVSTVNVDSELSKLVNFANRTETFSVYGLIKNLLGYSATIVGEIGLMKEHLTFVTEFDSILVNKINTFIKEHLDMNVMIESFVEDFHDLVRTINGKKGVDAVNTIMAYVNNIVNILRSEEVRSTANEFHYHEEPEDIHIGFVPSTYSLTYIPVDHDVLKLPKTKARMMIDSEKNRLVYKIARRLLVNPSVNDNPFNGEDGSLIAVENNILVTRDGVRYLVTKSFTNDDLFVRRL